VHVATGWITGTALNDLIEAMNGSATAVAGAVGAMATVAASAMRARLAVPRRVT
jgi:hypothetical protein